MRKSILFGIVILIISFGGLWINQRLALFSPNTLQPGQQRSIAADQQIANRKSQIVESVPYKIEPFIQNLEVPWSMVFTSPDRILVTERAGRIRAVLNDTLAQEPLFIFTEISNQEEEGLMGMTLDPNYSQNNYLYVCLAYPKNGDLVDKVVRLVDRQSIITVDKIIIDDIPAARFHSGCRLRFGPDNKLYITTGDATNKQQAQDLSSLAGKILRINPDGSIPDDNPIANSPVYSYGHRNPQGIDWHPVTNQLYSSEHGPSVFDGPAGGDEINRIIAGENYGWPRVSHENNEPGLTAPLITFTPAEAPGSGMFYSGTVFPQFTNDFFFGALKGEGIVRVRISESNPDEIVEIEKLPIEVGRIREIAQGPDGFIYFTTSNTDGRGNVQPGDDHIYRIIPQGK